MSQMYSIAMGLALCVTASAPLAATEVTQNVASSSDQKTMRAFPMPDILKRQLGAPRPCPEADKVEWAQTLPLANFGGRQHNFWAPAGRYLRIDRAAALVTNEPLGKATVWVVLNGVQSTRKLVPDSSGMFYRYPANGHEAPLYSDKGGAAHVEITRVKEGQSPNAEGYYAVRGCLLDKLPPLAVLGQNRPVKPLKP